MPPKSFRDRLVEANQGLAQREASRAAERTGLEFDDLFQVAMLGLVRAAERFDANRNLKFSTFAVPHCRGAVLSHVRSKGWRVYTPHRWREIWAKGKKLMEQNATDQDIADALYLDLDLWREIKAAHSLKFTDVKNVLLPASDPSTEAIAQAEVDEQLQAVEAHLRSLPPESQQRLINWVELAAKLTKKRPRKLPSFPKRDLRKLAILHVQDQDGSLNRGQLVARLAQQFPTLQRRKVDRVVGAVIDAIADELSRGHAVRLRGLGTLTLSATRGGFRADARLKRQAAKLK